MEEGTEGRRIGYRGVSNEIRANLIDHIMNNGLSLREAGQIVQPNISIVPQSMSEDNECCNPLVYAVAQQRKASTFI